MADAASQSTLKAFVSSTFEDLPGHRAYVIAQLRQAGIHVDPMEDWAADSDPPSEFCVERLEGCDLCVLLVAFRRGYVPDGNERSITQMEYDEARKQGVHVLPFLLDEDAFWKSKHDERRDDPAVDQWRQQLRTDHGVGVFTHEPASVPVGPAISRWYAKHFHGVEIPAPPMDEAQYLRALYKQTGYLEIRGLARAKQAYRFPISELYIPLTTTSQRSSRTDPRGDLEADEAALSLRGQTDLHRALQDPYLAIIGDPGAGKTTFLRRVASALCETRLGEQPMAARQRLGMDEAPFPIFVRLSELNEHVRTAQGRDGTPTVRSFPDWLPHYLAAAWHAACPSATEPFFAEQLSAGQAMVLLDGLDEAPSDADRRTLVGMIQQAVTAYPDCRFVVASRPAALRDETVFPGFAQAQIAPLEMDAIQTFLGHWRRALRADDTAKEAGTAVDVSSTAADESPQAGYDSLLTALQNRAELRRLARNPVMLTALAVVHWNQMQLPEQRAELYESILYWLSRQRQDRPGRPKPENCIGLLQNLALAMQNHADGRQVQVRRRWAAEQIADNFRDFPDSRQRVDAAYQFLINEELDSGIVAGRGDHDLVFWHLTFQEFLAARVLAARLNDMLPAVLDHLSEPTWREVILLLAGVLHQHDIGRVDQLVAAALDRMGTAAELPERARYAGILGAAVADLAPVNYRPRDPRYRENLDAVMAIFNVPTGDNPAVPINDAIAAAEALGQAGDPRLAHRETDRLWVTIPAGEFTMGSEEYDDEKPVHAVYLDEYRIGRYPVTVQQYHLFVENGGYENPKLWGAGRSEDVMLPGNWDEQLLYPTRPVTDVSWFEAMAYCAWTGHRLPTEAQWEKAARGTDQRRYPWGSGEPTEELLNSNGNVGRPTPVGVYPRGLSPYGVSDMAGNVLEWCADSYGAYDSRETRNPTGPSDSDRRLLRGGSWVNVLIDCRATYRYHLTPDGRNVYIGFRVVCGGQDSKRKP